MFALRASGLWLISSIRSDCRKYIQSVNSARPVLHGEFIARVLPLNRQILKDKTKAHTSGGSYIDKNYVSVCRYVREQIKIK